MEGTISNLRRNLFVEGQMVLVEIACQENGSCITVNMSLKEAAAYPVGTRVLFGMEKI